MTIIKTEVEGIYRDTTNGALLNKDNDALKSYKLQKAKRNILEAKVNNLESQMSRIEALLVELVEKNK